MTHAIHYFMWGYQPHFRINRECAAKRLFQALERRFEPEVFLVGILDDATAQRFPACVEPEEDFWIQSEEFNSVPSWSAEILKGYPEARMFQSHPLAQQRQDEDLRKRSIRDGIKKVIDDHTSKPKGITFYVSYPAKVDCYLVSVVLGLQKGVLDAYYSLKQTHVKMHEYRSVSVPVSLIDAAVSEFLNESAEQLLRPEPGVGLLSSDSEVDELLRAAGNRLANGLVWRIDQNCIEGMNNLFRACTTVSSLRYEKSASSGRIVLARSDHPAIDQQVQFSLPTHLANFRASRKMLELTSKDISLHSDSEKVYGLAKLNEYQTEAEDLFEVQILGHHHWELRHAGNVLMKVQYGTPRLPRLSFDERKFCTDLPRIFKNISDIEIQSLLSLVKAAEQEPHGTLLIISEAAAIEAERLKNQGTPIKPCRLTPDILRHLTPIDGAVILTPQGVCHSIGTILDGKATANGDPGRGARFNSAVRYYESSEAPCMAIVISEDGGVDFIPNPLPALRRSEIDERIVALAKLKDAEKISRTRYLAFVDWLEEHRFYLKERDCAFLNPLIEEYEERLSRESESSIRVIREKFTPHPGMDEALYYTNG